MSEHNIETHLVRMCTRRGAACYKSEPICAGFPDRMVLAPYNHVVFVETKAPGGEVAKNQEIIHRRLRRLGFRVEVLWSKEEVDRFEKEFFGEV